MPLLPSTTDDALFDNLLPGDIHRYARISKAAHSAVSSYIRRRFRIQDVLGKYFTEREILEFRRLQYYTGMFISGSTALQFFERTRYQESDLDVYVEHRYRRYVAAFMLKAGYAYIEAPEGWPLAGDEGPPESLEAILERVPDEEDGEGGGDDLFAGAFHPAAPTWYFGAAILLNFEKKNPHRKIQGITCHRAPLQKVLHFHSTCVMNVITHDRAYAVFPRATFDEHKTMINLPASARRGSHRAREELALEKYKQRGWEIISSISPTEFQDPKFMFSHGTRRLGDSKCWTIPLNPKLGLPERCMETSSWALHYDENLQPKISFAIFSWKRLKFSHLFVDELLRRYIEYVADEIERNKFIMPQTDDGADMEFRARVNRYLDLFYNANSTLSIGTTETEMDFEFQERVVMYQHTGLT
ncbi:hypothetical protein CPC08DRAFT_822453 [Agrocybe pediades]|nr:hypothetical protein CPC08DRAFT_822453 [Agrocybe pediades]